LTTKLVTFSCFLVIFLVIQFFNDTSNYTNYINYTFMHFVNEASVQHNIINYSILYFRRVKIKFRSIYSQHDSAIYIYNIYNNIIMLANIGAMSVFVCMHVYSQTLLDILTTRLMRIKLLYTNTQLSLFDCFSFLSK